MVTGRYRLQAQLGEGGAGVVWAAYDVSLRREVALKLLKPDLSPEGMLRERFLREARAAYAVRHVNVVHVHDVVDDEHDLIIVMERLHGETLASKLTREKRIAWPELRELMLQVFDAVQAAHDAQVVHRDLKPENIFLCEDGQAKPSVRVLDFGLAKLVRKEGSSHSLGVTRTGAMLGTPYYMSPEQVFGERWLDHRTDIWSLGVILYECLTGVRPTDGGNVGQIFKRITRGGIVPLREHDPTMAPAIADLVSRMLALDPDARPASVAEIRELLVEADAVEAEPAQPVQETPVRGTRASAPASASASAWSQSLRPRREWSLRHLLVGGLLLGAGAGAFAVKSLFEPVAGSERAAQLSKSGALTRASMPLAPASAPATPSADRVERGAPAGEPAPPDARQPARSQVPPHRKAQEQRRGGPSAASATAPGLSAGRRENPEDLFADPI
jgi:eukaryotic-like serine/threonine-protein kinase